MSPDSWNYYYTANGFLTTGEFLIGTSLNLICLTYFIRKRPTAINFIFAVISGTDLLLSSIMVFSAITAFSGGKAMIFENSVFCNIWGLLWHTGCGFSIFLMSLLAVTRLVGLARPLRKVKLGGVAGITLVYLAVQVFKSTMNYWYVGESYLFNSAFLGCSVSNINTLDITILDRILYTFLYIFEVMVPGVITIIFSVATFLLLLHKDKTLQSSTATPMKPKKGQAATSEFETAWKNKRYASVTVLMVLSTYLALNVWFWCLTLGDAFYIFSNKKLNYVSLWKGDIDSYYMMYYVIYIHTVVLNSAANGIIYLVRLKGIQIYMKSFIRGLK